MSDAAAGAGEARVPTRVLWAYSALTLPMAALHLPDAFTGHPSLAPNPSPGQRRLRMSMDQCTGPVLAPGEFCGFEAAFAHTEAGVREAEIILDIDLFARPLQISVLGTSNVVFFDDFQAR